MKNDGSVMSLSRVTHNTMADIAGKHLKTGFAILGCLLSCCCFAKISLPSVIDNNMVLQRQSKVALWGTTNRHTKVSINTSWNNKTWSVSPAADGSWKILVQTPAAGGPYRIVFSDGDKLVLSNVLIGEVWICSGQSNMEMPVAGFRNQPVENSNRILMQANNPEIRIFSLDRNLSVTPLKDAKSSGWQTEDPAVVKKFSAVGYQFAKMIQETLKVPVGIIGTYWGGTMIEAWMSAESLHSFSGIKIPKDTIGVNKNSPAVLYNAMINPLIGYGIRGMIWYQGEQNWMEPALYEKLLPAMVRDWRKSWASGDFPFYYVQIAPFTYPDKRELVPRLREAQSKSLDQIPAAGMVVTMDIGDEHTVHPRDKTTVSRRLAYWALANVYGKKGLEFASPVFRSMHISGDTINVAFDHAENGLTSFGREITGFELAEADSVFYPAHAVITGKGIRLTAARVKKPVAARYDFRDWVQGDLFGVDGLPVTPFRTDLWEKEYYNQ